MSLGENLQFLRKKNNITQEQLAERLDVSRQSVSKWESDTTYPEMDKLIQLCQMFHCSLDDLVQGNIYEINTEGKTEYDNHINQLSKFISLAVGIIISGVSVMFLLYGMNYFISKDTEIIREEFTGMIFLIFATIGSAILIVTGIQHSDFIKKHPMLDNFYTQKETDQFNKKFSIMIASGVSIILIGVIILVGLEAIYPEASSNEYLEALVMSLFLFFVAAGVVIIVFAGIRKEKYEIEKYNKSHDKESEFYKREQKKSAINGCIMLVATIIYLTAGFKFNSWGMPYAGSFAVGGICCAIASIIIESKK